MDDFIFALNVILPIVILIAFGYFLKVIKLLEISTLNNLNRIVFRILIPVSLFVNVYESSGLSNINITLLLFILIALVIIFILGFFLVKLLFKQKEQQGVILQGIFRSNYTVIGLALASSIAGEMGAQVAALCALVTIPIFGVLATISLIVFVEEKKDSSTGQLIWQVVKKTITNPLIVGVFLGVVCLGLRTLFEQLNIGFRLKDIKPVYSAIKSVAQSTTPFTLITLGGLFKFSSFKGLEKQVIATTLGKLVIVPVLALGTALLFFNFNGAEYAALIAVFASPVAASSVVMAKEMNNDDVLANQVLVWSTILSVFTIFLNVFLFKTMGIF